MNKLLFSIICLIPFLQIYTQQIGTWRNYTNMQMVNDALATNDGIWAVTTGGAFHYNFKNPGLPGRNRNTFSINI